MQSSTPASPDAVALPPAVSQRRTRLIGLAVALPCWAVLAVAVWLTPSESGYDTHTQLGLSPCSLPVTTGYPCPTCGMTTAFAWMGEGRPVKAFLVQPFGALLCVAVLVAALLGTAQTATGRPWVAAVPWRPWWAWAALGLFAAAWGYKIVVDGPWS
ncbi:MAG: DUF2752 domain-containing protein [Planctomycetes bacterium]|nr:DUF2752 domain-containing protein [Planctomycetota bacterium]